MKKKASTSKVAKLRKLHNPDNVIRLVQYRILSHILSKVDIPDYIYGFEKGKSVISAARCHLNKKVVISLDIKEFFDSIKQVRVEQIFKELGIGEDPSKILSELCTYRAYVPQGSLTAPKLSNIVASKTFGPEIKEFCDKQGLSLSIYADDITISYNNEFPNVEQAKAFATSISAFVTNTVEKYRFRINNSKTKIMPRHRRQWVCGAVVNEKVNMKKSERLQLRAIVHNASINGVEKEAHQAGMEPVDFIRKYSGRINWLCQLNPDAGVLLKKQFRKASGIYLKKYPEIEIPELAWNSGIENLVPVEEESSEALPAGDFEVV